MQVPEDPVELLKSVRSRWSLTQKELAAWLDLNRQTVLRWENEQVEIPRIAEYALRFLMMIQDSDMEEEEPKEDIEEEA